MMLVSLDRWLTKLRSGSTGLNKRGAKRRAKHLAQCLALGLASAWGASAEAVTIRLEVTPEFEITNSWAIFYRQNVSVPTPMAVSLGTIPAEQTSVWETDYPQYTLDDFAGLDYAVIGVYNNQGLRGISGSAPDDDDIVNSVAWEDALGRGYGPSVTEQHIVDSLLAGSDLYLHLGSLARVEYGQLATMVNFTTASYGGTALATIVPEPATWVLMVSAAGVVLAVARNRTTPRCRG